MRTSIFHALATAVLGISILAPGIAEADPYLLVNSSNDTVVKFDIATGAASLYAQYNAGDAPRNLAIDTQGNVYASLFGNKQNIVKLVPQPATNVLKSQDFTMTIPGDGPGQIHFYNGNLYAAGDEARVIYEFNGSTGSEIRTFSASTSYNIRAMTIVGSELYYSEIFQDRVRAFDLTQTPPTGGTFFTDSTHLNDSWNMTAGPGGLLVFANRGDTKLQEFNMSTGAFVGTLADLSTFNPSLTRSYDITYDAHLNDYFVSAGDVVYRLDTQGHLLQTYQSPLLTGASGVLTVPEPEGFGLFLIGATFAAAIRYILGHWRHGMGIGHPSVIDLDF